MSRPAYGDTRFFLASSVSHKSVTRRQRYDRLGHIRAARSHKKPLALVC